jgi:hypothetical protein
MTKLPDYPYLQNIVSYYRKMTDNSNGPLYHDDYITYLKSFGFRVPIEFGTLEFPDDFSEKDLMMFILRWS